MNTAINSSSLAQKENPGYKTEFVTSTNSDSFHQLAYQDWGDTSSTETVFCLHGLTRNSHDFDPLARRLAKSRRVICPDTVGRGDSDWLSNPDDYHINQYNHDFTVLATKIACTKFDIIGSSLGGLMGMMLAGLKNSPVRRLIINDIAPEIPHGAKARVGSYLHVDPRFSNLEEVEAYLRQTLKPFKPMSESDWVHIATHSSRKTNADYRLAFDPDISINYVRYWSWKAFNLWNYWANITCPVLILRGKESDFLTESLLRKMLTILPKAKVIEFAGVGHMPSLKSQEQIDLILKWLDEN
jgi:pimeloyl-ACP methyl ester carboxylesterase